MRSCASVVCVATCLHLTVQRTQAVTQVHTSQVHRTEAAPAHVLLGGVRRYLPCRGRFSSLSLSLSLSLSRARARTPPHPLSGARRYLPCRGRRWLPVPACEPLAPPRAQTRRLRCWTTLPLLRPPGHTPVCGPAASSPPGSLCCSTPRTSTCPHPRMPRPGGQSAWQCQFAAGRGCGGSVARRRPRVICDARLNQRTGSSASWTRPHAHNNDTDCRPPPLPPLCIGR